MPFRLRVRCSFHSNVPLIDFLDKDTTFENLIEVLCSLIKVSENEFKILSGYPPKILKGSKKSTLSDLGIKNGEVLVIESRASTDPPHYSLTSIKETEKLSEKSTSENIPCIPPEEKIIEPEVESKEEERVPAVSPKSSTVGPPPGIFFSFDGEAGMLKRHVVPADNSCLFASIDYVINGSISPERTKQMRVDVTNILQSNLGKRLVVDAVLDKPRKEYCEWIGRANSWGGEIELAVLCNHFALEIVALDAKTGRYNRFGESEGYFARGFLMYDGLHYDPIHMEAPGIQGFFYTTFPSESDHILAAAEKMVKKAHASGEFTDTDKFTLQCGNCGFKIKGETEAVKHAKETGHTAFEEYKS